jgi:hypothetical protein
MASLAFALPLLPGKTDDWRRWSQDLLGPRHGEYLASRRRLGVTAERAYLQRTPQADLVVVYIEVADLDQAFGGLTTSQEPFDVWFRQVALDLWGIDFGKPLPGPLSELVFDGIPG